MGKLSLETFFKSYGWDGPVEIITIDSGTRIKVYKSRFGFFKGSDDVIQFMDGGEKVYIHPKNYKEVRIKAIEQEEKA